MNTTITSYTNKLIGLSVVLILAFGAFPPFGYARTSFSECDGACQEVEQQILTAFYTGDLTTARQLFLVLVEEAI